MHDEIATCHVRRVPQEDRFSVPWFPGVRGLFDPAHNDAAELEFTIWFTQIASYLAPSTVSNRKRPEHFPVARERLARERH